MGKTHQAQYRPSSNNTPMCAVPSSRPLANSKLTLFGFPLAWSSSSIGEITDRTVGQANAGREKTTNPTEQLQEKKQTGPAVLAQSKAHSYGKHKQSVLLGKQHLHCKLQRTQNSAQHPPYFQRMFKWAAC